MQAKHRAQAGADLGAIPGAAFSIKALISLIDRSVSPGKINAMRRANAKVVKRIVFIFYSSLSDFEWLGYYTIVYIEQYTFELLLKFENFYKLHT